MEHYTIWPREPNPKNTSFEFVTTTLIFPLAHKSKLKHILKTKSMRVFSTWYEHRCVSTEKRQQNIYTCLSYGSGWNFCFRWHPFMRLDAKSIVLNNMLLNCIKDCPTDYVWEHLSGRFSLVLCSLFFSSATTMTANKERPYPLI